MTLLLPIDSTYFPTGHERQECDAFVEVNLPAGHSLQFSAGAKNVKVQMSVRIRHDDVQSKGDPESRGEPTYQAVMAQQPIIQASSSLAGRWGVARTKELGRGPRRGASVPVPGNSSVRLRVP